jgi:hypothetical protein
MTCRDKFLIGYSFLIGFGVMEILCEVSVSPVAVLLTSVVTVGCLWRLKVVLEWPEEKLQ